MNQHLDFKQLCALSLRLCHRHGFTPPAPRRVMENFFSPIPQPIVLRLERRRIWIDKYYAAFLEDAQPVYVYLTRRHIDEEREALRELARERGLNMRLPKEIEETFREAQRLMNRRGTDIWLAEKE